MTTPDTPEVEYKRPARLHRAFKSLPWELLRDEYNLSTTKPLGSGTRGVVYETRSPIAVVKLIDDLREPLVHHRLSQLKLKHVVETFGCHSFDLQLPRKDGTFRTVPAVLTYLERMHPLVGKRLEAHQFFHDAMTAGHPSLHRARYHVPRTYLRIFESQYQRASTEHRHFLDEFREVLEEIISVGEWHRDLKIPNLMTDENDVLKISDIGSFTERPLLVSRFPPVSAQEYEEAALANERLLHPVLRHAAAVLREEADYRYGEQKYPRIVSPLDGLMQFDPHYDDSDATDPYPSSEIAYVPDEIVHLPRPTPDDPASFQHKWHTPTDPNGPGQRIPVQTYDLLPDQSAMNGSPASQYYDHHRKV